MNKHPYRWLPDSIQPRAFGWATLLAVALMLVLQGFDRPLRTAAAPQGIVSFELAGNQTVAQGILGSWAATARVYAGLSLGLDYLFMAAYASAISLGCVWAVRTLRLPRWLGQLGILLAWGQFIAAGLDAVENVALIQQLLGAQAALWPLIARWCAIPKFVLVGAGLIYALAGLGVMGWRSVRG